MKMLDRTDLHHYQIEAVEFVKQRFRTALLLDMGLGKSTVTLTAIWDLMQYAWIWGTLVMAPRRVAEGVWAQEATKWRHLSGLDVCVLRGRSKPLLIRELARHHHVYVINYESIPWLFTQLNNLFLSKGRPLPFNCLVLDELTRVKNSEGKRITPWYRRNPQGYCMMDHFPFRIGLTGTPAPNGYWDLFGQYLALDDGRALGVNQIDYKIAYFNEDPMSHRKTLKKGAGERIHSRIAPITLSMRARDYLELPEEITNDIWVELPPDARRIYDQFERQMFADLDDQGTRLQVFNASTMTMKCRQLANGIVIDPEVEGMTHAIHEAKIEALDSVVSEANGQPILCAYVFRADARRIQARYGKQIRVSYLNPGTSDKEAVDMFNAWNSGQVQMLITHPKSGGHGLNIQFGGHTIVWFGLDYTCEEYLQLNARLTRQGQVSNRVIIHRILARGTVDHTVRDSLERKEVDQATLRQALEAYKRNKTAGRLH